MTPDTLIAWEEKRIPARPRKKWASGVLSVVFAICALLLFIFHPSWPLPHPVGAVLASIIALALFVLGTIAYQKEAARVEKSNKTCRHCGHPMEAHVVDLRKSQLHRADLSRTALLRRFIVKDRLFEGQDHRIYMAGKKSRSPGQGYAAWKGTGFLLKARWLACSDCRCSYIHDTVFETIAEGDAEVEAFLDGKTEIVRLRHANGNRRVRRLGEPR